MNAIRTSRPSGLLAWQWSGYAATHADRRNLVVHAVTNPLFMLGCAALPASLVVAWWLAPAGALAVLVAMAAQGRGHAHEGTPPAPFRGALDVAGRILAEQWITFPRFVLSGGFRAALRATSSRT
jgi:hypothetical protein